MIGSLLRIRYEVLQELESSSIFDSFRVKDRVGGREVKVRIVLPPFSQEADFLARVREVISEHAALKHPSLERMLELDDHEGTPFIVSDLPPGAPLHDKIRKLAPFSASVAVQTAVSVCDALSALHEENFAHGDVTSSNIYVTQDGKAKLALAGIWRAYAASRTAGMVMLPSMAPYLAPEISEGAMPSPATDVYAVGVLMYELLAGRYPFSADTPVAMALKHATAPVPSVRLANPGVPGVLEEIVKKAMAKLPGDRYPNARALMNDLRVVQDGIRFGKQLSWPLKQPGNMPEPTPEPAPQLVAPRMSAIRPERTSQPAPKPTAEVDLTDRLPRWITALGYLAVCAVVVMIGGYFAWNLTSPRQVKVPNLVGQTALEAEKQLEKLKLKLKTEEMENNQPAGTILKSEPPAESKVKEGGTIFATVSSGSRFVELPDLRGRTIDEAKDIIKKLGLKIEQVSVASADFDQGVIIKQSPKARQKLEKNSTVKAFVSNGRRSGGGIELGAKRRYQLAFELNTPDSVLVRVDMIDDIDTHTVFEAQCSPGEPIDVDKVGVGDQVIFKIYYDGELVKQQTVSAKVTVPADEPPPDGAQP